MAAEAAGAADRPDATGPAAGRRRGLTLAAVCLAPFVTQLATFALSPFLPFVAADLATSVSLVGQIPALGLLTAAALGLVVGPLADRVGHRLTLLGGVVASSVGALLTAAAPSLLVLVPVALVGAGGRSIGLPVAQAFVGAHYRGPQMRRGIGLTQATGTLAPLVGIPLVTAIGAAAGWRTAFLALGLLGLATAALMRWLLPPDRPSAPHTAPSVAGAFREAFAAALADRPLRWLYASTLTRNLGVWALTVYLGAYLVQVHDLDTAQVGWVFTVTGVGNFLGSVATAGPLGRLPLAALAIAAPFVIAASLGAVTILPLGIETAVLLLLLGFFGNGVAIVSQNTMLVSRGAGRATTTSLNQTCMSLGGALGGSVGGLLLATGGFPALGLLTLGCVVASAVCLLPARGVRAA